MSALKHTAKTVADPTISGTWRSICSCGWKGKLRGGKGARNDALNDRYKHLEDMSQ